MYNLTPLSVVYSSMYLDRAVSQRVLAAKHCSDGPRSERNSNSSSPSSEISSDSESTSRGQRKSVNDDSTLITNASTVTRAQQRKTRSQHRKKKKSQHSLDYLRQHVSKLMSIFEFPYLNL